MQAEEESRRYQQELSIAASIQQRLMQVKIPEVPFAKLRGKNLSCKEIGGDFFDAVNTKEGLAVVLADVSGKGVSAALLASTLQGMIYSHLSAGVPLLDVVVAVNRFFTEKLVGEKYATVLLVRLRRDGDLEYVNCGHVQPLLVCGGRSHASSARKRAGGPARRRDLRKRALPDEFRRPLHPGDRRRHRGGKCHGRLLSKTSGWKRLRPSPRLWKEFFLSVTEFCAGNPLSDDCTVVELCYTSVTSKADA